ncbi:hypothetical protein WJ69_01840 [Burkholderia ubonensis]|uniref:RidA family protein n=1 Tax=Burkholderia ubonensis TaxID=101571 RepID=UPI00075CE466|nr:RidA family protein [Burkholderia ubonensis]KVN98170.1 hypothetical protein WJ69_01840 [Burkholderia ubonensis]
MKVSRLLAMFSLSLCCLAQVQRVQAAPRSDQVPFSKKNVYGEWSKDLFADASIVEGGHRTIYVAGMAAENPKTGVIDHQGNFDAQCKMAYGKIQTALRKQGFDMSDIVRTVAYVTDSRYTKAYLACQKEALGGAPLPPHTLLNVSQLAWPGMMVEVDVTAVAPVKHQ